MSKYLGKRVKINKTGETGIIVAFDNYDGDYVFIYDDRDYNPDSVFIDADDYIFIGSGVIRVDNIMDYLRREYDWFYSVEFTPIKLYPNTELFKKLYPNGTEKEGFWEVC
jgi:hypothetical protein